MSTENAPLGSITLLKMIPSQYLSTFTRTRTRCSLTLREGASWIELRARDIDISITGKDSDAGLIYNVSGSFRCPKTSGQSLGILEVYGRDMMLLCETASEDIYIVGTPHCPLTIVESLVTPSVMASFSGYSCSVSGSQMHPQLLLVTP